jgi:hypothetical protein
VLRKRWRSGGLTERRFRSAIEDLLALPFVRFPSGPLMLRAYELPLVTADARLERAAGVRCGIELLTD